MYCFTIYLNRQVGPKNCRTCESKCATIFWSHLWVKIYSKTIQFSLRCTLGVVGGFTTIVWRIQPIVKQYQCLRGEVMGIQRIVKQYHCLIVQKSYGHTAAWYHTGWIRYRLYLHRLLAVSVEFLQCVIIDVFAIDRVVIRRDPCARYRAIHVWIARYGSRGYAVEVRAPKILAKSCI